MNLYDNKLDKKAFEAGLSELLAFARVLQLQKGYNNAKVYPGASQVLPQEQKSVKPLPKSENIIQQHRKPFRQSGITTAMRSRIVRLGFERLLYQKIVDTIYQEFGKSVSKSTVSKIINDKYKPKAVR